MRPNRDSFITAIICSVIAIIVWMVCMSEAAHADWNEEGTYEVQDTMWEILMEEFDGNAIATSAVMGNAGVESNFCPWRYCGQNDPENDYIESKEYADSCTENEFIYCWQYTYPPGYGLFQFSTNYHMKNIWDLAQDGGVPVYDTRLQTEYMMANFKAKQPEAYEALAKSEDLVDAVEIFRSFGIGSTFSEYSSRHRTNRALEIYERYTGETYEGEIHLPLFNGGSMHYLKE